MSRYLWCVLPFFVIGCLFSCKDDGGPPPPDGPDTTSHNFTFTLDTLGDGNSSVLNDVAIISEDNVWAVGELYYRDSVGGFSEPMFNAARWNGSTWELKRIPVRDFGNVVGIFPLKTVFGFSTNDVWFASDADLIQWDGATYRPRAFFMTSLSFDGQVQCMWGTSATNIYCAGRTGSIYHYAGSTWQRLTSGTTVDIQDIWGATNPQNGETEVLAVASNLAAVPQARNVLQISGTTVSAVNDTGSALALSGIWFSPGQKYYLVGDGVYYVNSLGEDWQLEPNHPLLYKNSLSGHTLNDLMITGAYGLVSHFNGSTWQHFGASYYGQYLGADYRNGLLVAVGWIDNRAVAIRGRRTD